MEVRKKLSKTREGKDTRAKATMIKRRKKGEERGSRKGRGTRKDIYKKRTKQDMVQQGQEEDKNYNIKEKYEEGEKIKSKETEETNKEGGGRSEKDRGKHGTENEKVKALGKKGEKYRDEREKSEEE